MILTVGHSTLDPVDFITLCRDAKLDAVWDIRSHPTSRWPQFWQEFLVDWLPNHDIDYVWESGLGGWDVRHLPLADEMLDHGVDLAAYSRGKFPKQRIAPARPGGQGPAWTNQGLWDYQWFMTLSEFKAAGERLIEAAEGQRIGIMCAEVLWWKCHRSMVADWLFTRGADAWHLQPKLTCHADALGNRLQRYESGILDG